VRKDLRLGGQDGLDELFRDELRRIRGIRTGGFDLSTFPYQIKYPPRDILPDNRPHKNGQRP
jgi:hypothetical protein